MVGSNRDGGGDMLYLSFKHFEIVSLIVVRNNYLMTSNNNVNWVMANKLTS